MTQEELLKQQLKFIDYIYPSLSQQIDDLKNGHECLNRRIIELIEERKYWIETIGQYKNKIQRIEQFLINHGLIKLLGKEIKE